MAPDYPSTSNTNIRKKRRRKVLTLHEKMTILKKIERGRTYSSLAREYNCNESSIRTIKKSENKIKTSISMLANPASVKSTFLSRRDTIIEQMEHLLNVWIDDQTIKKVPLSSNMIRQQARSIYDHLKSLKPKTATASAESSFFASKGWFDRFRKRANLHNICVVSEGVSADGEGVDNFKSSTCWAKIPREDESESQEQNNIHTAIEKIINLSNMIEREGFSDTEQKEILDTVNSDQDEELKNENLQEMLDANTEVLEEEEGSEQEKQTEATSKNISEILKAAEFLKEQIMQEDPDLERSTKIRKEIDSIMKVYADIKKTEQQHAEITDSIKMSIPASDVYSL